MHSLVHELKHGSIAIYYSQTPLVTFLTTNHQVKLKLSFKQSEMECNSSLHTVYIFADDVLVIHPYQAVRHHN